MHVKEDSLEAKYDYIVWCDDDNWLQEEYLLIALNTFTSQKQMNIGVLGGNGKAFTACPPPSWLEYAKHTFALGPQEKNSGPVKKLCVWGRSYYLQARLPHQSS